MYCGLDTHWPSDAHVSQCGLASSQPGGTSFRRAFGVSLRGKVLPYVYLLDGLFPGAAGGTGKQAARGGCAREAPAVACRGGREGSSARAARSCAARAQIHLESFEVAFAPRHGARWHRGKGVA